MRNLIKIEIPWASCVHPFPTFKECLDDFCISFQELKRLEGLTIRVIFCVWKVHLHTLEVEFISTPYILQNGSNIFAILSSEVVFWDGWRHWVHRKRKRFVVSINLHFSFHFRFHAFSVLGIISIISLLPVKLYQRYWLKWRNNLIYKQASIKMLSVQNFKNCLLCSVQRQILLLNPALLNKK